MALLRSIKSYALITLITLLIWLYAEGQDVASTSTELVLRLPELVGRSRVVDFLDSQGVEPVRMERLDATVTFKGASAPLSQLRAALANGQLVLPIKAADLPEGQQQVTLALGPLLGKVHLRPEDPSSPTLADMGLSVTSAEPAEITLRVDELVSRPVRVVFNPPGAHIRAVYNITPSQVPVTLLQSQVDQIAGSEDAFFFEATIPLDKLNAMPVGERLDDVSLGLQLRAPGLDEPYVQRRIARRIISWPTDSVSVSFSIARQNERYDYPQSVPVWLIASPSELARFKVELDETDRVLTNVLIEGPRALIEALREPQRKLRVIARFEMSSEQFERDVTKAPLTSIEIIENVDGRSQVLYSVPLNPQALEPGVDRATVPTFVSPQVSVTVEKPVVNFTVTRLGG